MHVGIKFVPSAHVLEGVILWLSHLCSVSFLFLKNIFVLIINIMGFPGGTSGKEPFCQCRRHKRWRLDPWFGKIPWRRKWQPTPIFLPGRIPWTEKHKVAKSWTWLKQLSTHIHILCVCVCVCVCTHTYICKELILSTHQAIWELVAKRKRTTIWKER